MGTRVLRGSDGKPELGGVGVQDDAVEERMGCLLERDCSIFLIREAGIGFDVLVGS